MRHEFANDGPLHRRFGSFCIRTSHMRRPDANQGAGLGPSFLAGTVHARTTCTGGWELASENWELRVKAGAYRARAPKGQPVKARGGTPGTTPHNDLCALKGHRTAGRSLGLSWAAPLWRRTQRLSVAAGTPIARTAPYEYDFREKPVETSILEGFMNLRRSGSGLIASDEAPTCCSGDSDEPDSGILLLCDSLDSLRTRIRQGCIQGTHAGCPCRDGSQCCWTSPVCLDP